MHSDQKRLDLLQQFYALQDNEIEFNSLALSLYEYQLAYNLLYRRYVETIGRDSDRPTHFTEIPCLPIQFFKTTEIKTNRHWPVEKVFRSSGTGGIQSCHYIRDLSFYLNHAKQLFDTYIGPIESYCFLGLLPGYLEREGSSLIEMIHHFIQLSPFEDSGFYLRNHEDLAEVILKCQRLEIPTILFGVSFALLDFAEETEVDLKDVIIIETGGMKGTRKEMTKMEVIRQLQFMTGAEKIFSEYGMTELLSQAYSLDGVHFKTNKSLRVFASEINDPFSTVANEKSGQLNIVDLANIDSCAFIQTDDMGRLNEQGTFEILGRIDQSDLRGCNLLLEEIS